MTVTPSAELLVVLDSSVEDQQRWPADLPEPAGFGFRRVLTERQRTDVARLLAMRHGGNFGVPGSGKTTVAYCLWAAERCRDEIDGLLVVAPPSAFEAWTMEAEACFTEETQPKVEVQPPLVSHRAEVVVIGYPRLLQRRVFAELDSWLSSRRVMIVFDESHRVKAGQRGAWGRAAARLAARCQRRYVLSGTPMPNSLADIAAQFDLCWPGSGKQLAHGELAPSRDRIFVRTTKDQLNLPKLRTTIQRVPLDHEHRQVYEALAGHAVRLLDDPSLVRNVSELGAAVLRIIAAASNPAAVLDVGAELALPVRSGGASLEDVIRNAASQIRPAKLLRAAQLVEANAARGRKTLVWSVFVSNVRALADLLAAHHPAVITGATPFEDPRAQRDRVRELRRFRTDPACSVLIATPQTLGEGISLHQVCVDQIHVDRTFNAGLYLQSLDRTHRLGMPADSRPTTTLLLAEDTIDTWVHELLGGKIIQMSRALNDLSLERMQLPDIDESLTLRDVFLEGEESAAALQDLLTRVRGH
ncbi:DEAD/DEAH box helicase [Pseudonocardiaceae bacterium YIM PH 21723]|nr:DEAD/DEAH box helicase [Pseudonocardiaceae bacterium YIM PH 21723]